MTLEMTADQKSTDEDTVQQTPENVDAASERRRAHRTAFH